jgi:hypothetical protein
MDKKGTEGFTMTLYAAFELIVAVITIGIIFSLVLNPDALSNANKIFAKNDIELLGDTIDGAPGSVEYTYQLKKVYDLEFKDEVTITKNAKSITDGYTFRDITFTKNQGSKQIEVKNG